MPVMQEMNVKYGPLPLWMWGAGTAVLGAWYLIHRKNKTAQQNAQSTQAAADQTNTNLGSASQLANLFEVAGLMPYQGGDTYVNITTPPAGTGGGGTPVGPSQPVGPGGPINQGGTATHPLPIPTPAGAPQPPKTTTGSTAVGTYTVKSGDTLWGLAPKLGFGSGSNYMQLYNYDGNANTIENTAKQHGHFSNFANWIFPGETLHYPVRS